MMTLLRLIAEKLEVAGGGGHEKSLIAFQSPHKQSIVEGYSYFESIFPETWLDS